MAKGLITAAVLMANMMPEEMLVEKTLEALQEYKVLGMTGKPPKAEFMMLIMKWDNAGKSMEEIVKQCQQDEEKAAFANLLGDQDISTSN